MINIKSRCRTKAILGLLFLAPTIIGILVFTAGPIGFSMILSFFYWDVLTPMKFAGVDNYEWLIQDDVAVTAFRNTIVFAVAVVILQNVLGFTLAPGPLHS